MTGYNTNWEVGCRNTMPVCAVFMIHPFALQSKRVERLMRIAVISQLFLDSAIFFQISKWISDQIINAGVYV
jgi:hypothetical protein